MKSYFNCYIEGSGDQWEAICVDLDISVTARSLAETKALLDSAVASYVHDALQEAEPARSQLLSRRSPLSVRLAWRARMALFALVPPRNKPRFEGSFALPCPV
ncbi:MAG: hypothetical protein P4L76_01320 [Beijerinckiaceae bacterium]|nr:hypothetical protein [Beijerinckiaceae bacterium]